MTFVYDFDERCDGGRALLGGKGLGLAEMTQLGLPVPPGFTVTTEACRLASERGSLPGAVLDEILDHVRSLEARSGKRFGSIPCERCRENSSSMFFAISVRFVASVKPFNAIIVSRPQSENHG